VLTSSKRNNSNTKEVLKMVVGLMIEDIWSNFDNYKLQSQVLLKRSQIPEKPAKKFEDDIAEPSQKVVELRRKSSSIKGS
jgi:hypothetical protein